MRWESFLKVQIMKIQPCKAMKMAQEDKNLTGTHILELKMEQKMKMMKKKVQKMELVQLVVTLKMHPVNKFLRSKWTILLFPWTIQTLLMPAKISNSLPSTQWWVVAAITKAGNFTYNLIPSTEGIKSEILVKAMVHLPNSRAQSWSETAFWSTSVNHML